MDKARILVQGIVQGVGFRPTVYRLARALDLRGYVRNLGNIVEIVLEGNKSNIKQFSKISRPKSLLFLKFLPWNWNGLKMISNVRNLPF